MKTLIATIGILLFLQPDLNANTSTISSNKTCIAVCTSPFDANTESSAPKSTMSPNWIMTRTATAPNGSGMVSDIRYFNGLGLPIQDVSIQNTPRGADLVIPYEYDAVLRDDARSYLPYPAADHSGAFRYDALHAQALFYQDKFGAEGERAFSEKEYEASPLGRMRRMAGPGVLTPDGEPKYASVEYLGNSANEVFCLKVTDLGDTLFVNGYYPQGTLSKIRTRNEDGVVSMVFANLEGQTLLSRVLDAAGNALDTYNVYDHADRLRWVVSPEGAASLSSSSKLSKGGTIAQEYCYIYKYDGRGNVIQKKLPGRALEYFIYDLGGRLVMNQDGNMRAKGNQWLLIGYDAFDRESTRHLLTTTLNFNQLTAVFAEGRQPELYGSSSAQLESYYSYSMSEIPEDLVFAEVSDIVSEQDVAKSSQRAYEKIRILAETAVEKYVERAFYYDNKGRLIQTVIRNQLGGIDRISNSYDFRGNVLSCVESHSKNADAEEDVLIRHFSYDSRGRLLSEVASLNNEVEGSMNYGYDELGNLISRQYGGDSQLINEELSYNIRGWLTSQSNEEFAMSLAYNSPLQPETLPSYTGNITEWSWTHADSGEENTYAFTYDCLSRLTDTHQYIQGIDNDQFVEKNISYDRNGNLRSLHRYEQGALQHDYAYTYTGNRLKTVSDRQASSRMRSFAYSSPADSLGNISPGSINPDLPIDPIDPTAPGTGIPIPPIIDPIIPEGPITPIYPPIDPDDPENPGPFIPIPPGIVDPTDPDHGGGILDPDDPHVIISPDSLDNPLNPVEPEIPRDSLYSGSEYVYDANGNMLYDPNEGLNIRYNRLNLLEKVYRGDTLVAKYSYLSDGTKLSAIDSDDTGLCYLGSLVYNQQAEELILDSAPFGGGRLVSTSMGTESHYFLTDHLGSVRVIVNNYGIVTERNDYYPFGLRWNVGYLSYNRYRYNGKETQSFVDVPYSDYGARMLDSKYRLSWNGGDLMAENHFPISPYAFCGNNPVNRIDLNGMDWYEDENGNTQWRASQDKEYIDKNGVVW